MSVQISCDLLKRLLIKIVENERRLYGEFSGDMDGSEYELWQDPLLREGLAVLGSIPTAGITTHFTFKGDF